MTHYEKKISSKEVFRGDVITVTVDEVELENGKTSMREIVHHNGGACIAAITESNELLVVNQFRYAYGEELLELPAGKLEKGEDPFKAAKRELAEEAGVVAGSYINLGLYYPTTGYNAETIYLYGAKNLTVVGQNLDQDEFLNVLSVPLDTFCEKCLSGEIKDGKTITASLRLQYALQHNLF